MRIFKVYKDFFQFILNPNKVLNTGKILRFFLLEYIILYITNIILRVLIFLFAMGFYDIPQTSSDLPSVSFFLAVILGPLMEELGFRLSLKFSKLNLSISSVVLLYYFITKFIFKLSIFDFESFILLRVLIPLSIGVLMYFLASIYKTKLSSFFSEKLQIIVFVSSFLFGLIHFDNINSIFPIYLYLLFLFPYFLSGLIYSYFRIKYSFSYNTSAHILTNFSSKFLSKILSYI